MRDATVGETPEGNGKLSVLIADDVHGDRFLIKRAIRASAPALTVVGEVEDGAEILAYLAGDDKYADRERYPFPDLLLLDLRMPFMDGFEVLAWLRERAFPRLEVVVLTGSLESDDRQRVSDLGVKKAYLKPWRCDALAEVFRMLASDLAGNSH